jgi:hypothetical protein
MSDYDPLAQADASRTANFYDFYTQARVIAAWRGDISGVIDNELKAERARERMLRLMVEEEGYSPEWAAKWVEQYTANLKAEAHRYMEEGGYRVKPPCF